MEKEGGNQGERLLLQLEQKEKKVKTQQRERVTDALCNKRLFGSGNVSNIADRMAFKRASFRSSSSQTKQQQERSTFKASNTRGK